MRELSGPKRYPMLYVREKLTKFIFCNQQGDTLQDAMERSLSTNEAKIILDLEWRGQKTVTLAELREALGASEGYARYLAHRLVAKRWLERLRPGLFQLVPADRGREGIADMHPLTAGAVLVAPYFFSFGTACTHHGLTEQVFAEIYIACQKRRRPQTIRGKRYVFVHVPEERFFGYREIAVLGQPIQMATLERALLDAIDRPQYAGGIGEVSRIVARAAPRIAWAELLELARRWGSSALVQRLGYFLDLHQATEPDDVRASLLGLIGTTSKIQLGSRRRWSTTGTLVRPWNVVENVPRDVLLSTTDKPRRRVVFHREAGR
jgi:predicted transcriptional regulator of viral defense system